MVSIYQSTIAVDGQPCKNFMAANCEQLLFILDMCKLPQQIASVGAHKLHVQRAYPADPSSTQPGGMEETPAPCPLSRSTQASARIDLPVAPPSTTVALMQQSEGQPLAGRLAASKLWTESPVPPRTQIALACFKFLPNSTGLRLSSTHTL